MSQNAANSTPGVDTAQRTSSMPRSPAPMMPMRTFSFAPSTAEGTAKVPASPDATFPIKIRRDCMTDVLRFYLTADAVNVKRHIVARVLVPCDQVETGPGQEFADELQRPEVRSFAPVGTEVVSGHADVVCSFQGFAATRQRGPL